MTIFLIVPEPRNDPAGRPVAVVQDAAEAPHAMAQRAGLPGDSPCGPSAAEA
jgi:hypothetical protein